MRIFFSCALSSLFPVITIGLLLVGFFICRLRALQNLFASSMNDTTMLSFKSSNLAYIWDLGVLLQPFKGGLSSLSDSCIFHLGCPWIRSLLENLFLLPWKMQSCHAHYLVKVLLYCKYQFPNFFGIFNFLLQFKAIKISYLSLFLRPSYLSLFLRPIKTTSTWYFSFSIKRLTLVLINIWYQLSSFSH